MQLLPDTAKGIALRTGGDRFVVADLRDPEINVRYGSWYLDHLPEPLRRPRLMLAAYHAGQGNVDRWRADGVGIAFPETRSYVADVLRIRDVYADAYPSSSASCTAERTKSIRASTSLIGSPVPS